MTALQIIDLLHGQANADSSPNYPWITATHILDRVRWHIRHPLLVDRSGIRTHAGVAESSVSEQKFGDRSE